MTLTTSSYKAQILIALAATILFVPFLGGVHLFDWDEINFAECAREMIASGDYLTVQINYMPFWEKPPLFIWMQVLSMHLFGVGEYAARLPNAICGILTLLFIFNIGKRLYDVRFGLIWALAYAGSVLPHLYFRSGIIDPWFNLLIFAGIYYFIQYNDLSIKENASIAKRFLYAALSAAAIGLAILTKGPVALLIYTITISIYIFIAFIKTAVAISAQHGKGKRTYISAGFDALTVTFSGFRQHIMPFCLWMATLLLVGGAWFILQIIAGNYRVVADFVLYQIKLFSTKDAGHGGFPGYHCVVLFFGVFPASVFALKAFQKSSTDNATQHAFKVFMSILFWVVLIMFSIVRTQIVHYSSLCYYPMTFFAAWAITKIVTGELEWNRWINVVLISIAALIFAIFLGLEYVGCYTDSVVQSGLIKNAFVNANLQAQVYWSGFEFVVGLIPLAGIVFAILFFKKEKLLNRAIAIFAAGCVFTSLAIIVLVPRIEGYSQRAAVEFYEGLQEQDCYVATEQFKSYGYLFYSRKPLQANKNHSDVKWLITGEVDKKVYIVSKITAMEEIQAQYPQLEKLYEKNGFVFFERK